MEYQLSLLFSSTISVYFPLVSFRPLSHFHQTLCQQHSTASSKLSLVLPFSLNRHWLFSLWSAIVSSHNQPPTSLGSLLIAYNTTLSTVLDKHSPVITKFTTCRSKSSTWFSSTLRAFRANVRHAENLFKCTHSALDWSSFKSLHNHYHKLILSAKKQYYSHLVSSSSESLPSLANCK